MKNIAYLLALHSIDGLGPVRLKKILDHFDSDPKLAWEVDIREIKELGIPEPTCHLIMETRKKLDPEKFAETIQKSGIKWMTFFDPDYPKLLKQIYDPPIILYYKGELLPEDEKAIGVVGTRKMTGYGKSVTEDFTKGLVAAGLTIVSGLAQGVDAAAHQAALDAGGRTLAILGGGLNYIFPPQNIRLAEEIASGRGALICEFPPEYPSMPGNFPARNRIISGLSLAILVTEAAEDSGSLITGRLALEQGREVFAVPGPITSNLSKGPISLIREGARVVMEVGEILEELGIGSLKNNLQTINTDSLSEQEKKILACLENENKHIDDICRELNLKVAEVSGNLLKMEITGLVRNLGGGIYGTG